MPLTPPDYRKEAQDAFDAARIQQQSLGTNSAIPAFISNLTPEQRNYLENQGYGGTLDELARLGDKIGTMDPVEFASKYEGLASKFDEVRNAISPEGVRDQEHRDFLNKTGMGILDKSLERQKQDRERRSRFLSQADQARQGLVGAYGRTADVARTGDSPATQQLRDALAGANRSTQAMANSAVSGSGLARRAAQQTISGQAAGQQQQVEALRQQEMINARQQLGGMAGAMRQRSLQGAELGSGSEQGYVQSALQGLAGAQGQAAAIQDLKQQMEDGKLSQAEFNNQKAQIERQSTMNLVGGVTGAAGSTLASVASDQDLKTDIHPADMASFLSKIRPSTYKYTEEGQQMDKEKAKGRQIGVMAQDLEESDVGKSMVSENKKGKKQVDVGKAAMASLAANAYLKDRMDQLEAALSGAGAQGEALVRGAAGAEDLRRGLAADSPMNYLRGPATAPPAGIPDQAAAAMRQGFAQEQPFAPVMAQAQGRGMANDAEARMRAAFQQYRPFAPVTDPEELRRAAETAAALRSVGQR